MVEGFPIPTGQYASDGNPDEAVHLSHLHAQPVAGRWEIPRRRRAPPAPTARTSTTMCPSVHGSDAHCQVQASGGRVGR